MNRFVFIAALLLGTGTTTADDKYEALINEALSLVKEGLRTYPHIHHHLLLPAHEDFTRLESLIAEIVPKQVAVFLQDQIARCKDIKDSKEELLTSLENTVKSNGSDGDSKMKIKTDLDELTHHMLKEMEAGKGSLDFELDNVARMGLGDVYLHVKSKISENLQGLKECQSHCGFTNPMIIRVLSLLQSWKEDASRKLASILLGVPGLETMFIRPQLVQIRTSLPGLEEQDFKFLVLLGEWLNDVLNSGLIVLKKPFGEIRGELIEILGTTKDDAVPRIQNILKILEDQKQSLGLVLKNLNTVIMKCYGRF